ncbi:hypothetical protein DXG03_001701 [Asterophora parasitica]|uniref:Glycoside hydrolase family 17 protein n=1 Tax=Asterophora parasitica TaxID=117018 RepID=A0A9P7KDW9_9AGAR|nr:hypothetical protein DXG03_001701 [Asterophora parasitica]
MANVHPWFANVSAADGAGWTAQFFQTTNVDAAAALSNNPKMYIAETGWPTFFDEPWKDAQFGGVEGWWGLFTAK